MSANEVMHLAKALIEKGTVTFSFFDTNRPGERLVVCVREADEWDRLDAEAEGNPEVEIGEDFMVCQPQKGQTAITTSLRFQNAYEASSAVFDARLSILRKQHAPSSH